MPENSGKTENFIVKIDQQVIDAVVWGLCQKWDLRNRSGLGVEGVPLQGRRRGT
jgi:hypothetical protein